MKIFTSYQIKQLRIAIAQKENMLPEDVSDKFLFECIEDYSDDDIHFHGSNDASLWTMPILNKEYVLDCLFDRYSYACLA